jgi:hypothetical protein
MQKNEEHWKRLCQQAATEHDPRKLLELTRQINDLMSSTDPIVDVVASSEALNRPSARHHDLTETP